MFGVDSDGWVLGFVLVVRLWDLVLVSVCELALEVGPGR